MTLREPATLLAARLVYSMQWYVLAPVTLLMMQRYHAPVWLSGVLPFIFIVGAAATQLPGIAMSSRIGARNTFVLGLMILSLSDIAMSMANNIVEAVILRFIAGLGTGLFFAPAGYVLVSVSEAPSSWLMGLYNAAFNLGGFVAILWGLVYGALGVRAGLLAAGALGIAMSLVSLLAIKFNGRPSAFYGGSVPWRDLLLIGLAGSGAFGASYALGSFLPSLARLAFMRSPFGSGTLTSLNFVGAALGGALLLKVPAKLSSSRRFVVAAMLLSTVSYLLLYTSSYYLFLTIVFINGLLVDLAFSSYYSYLVESYGRSLSAVSLATINMINMVGSLWIFVAAGIALQKGLLLETLVLAVANIVTVPAIYATRR